MKKLKTGIFAAIMTLSIVFIGGAISSGDTSMSAAAQTTVKRKRKAGIARQTYHGGRYVVRRTWDGTKWVSRRVWVATKWTGKTTYKTGRKVVSRTKKVVY